MASGYSYSGFAIGPDGCFSDILPENRPFSAVCFSFGGDARYGTELDPFLLRKPDDLDKIA
jgi:hypothetical protein